MLKTLDRQMLGDDDTEGASTRETHSGIAHLLRNVMPRDPETCGAENLERLQEAANGAAGHWRAGLAVFGKCLIREEVARGSPPRT